MSDLSRMLDDLYDLSPDDESAPVASSTPPAAPSWASEDALDEAFGGWIPGPADDASATERSLVADAVDAPVVPAPVDAEWLLATEPLDLELEAAPVPVGALAGAVAMRRWTPSEDDILPAKSARKKRR